MLTYGKRLYIRGATFHIWDNVFEKYFPLLRFQFSKFWIIYKKILCTVQYFENTYYLITAPRSEKG